MQLLESSGDIRMALGEAYHLIRGVDTLVQERARTAGLRKQLMNTHQRVCASCGDAPGGPALLEAAHILALEEAGSTTERNLVLLCHECHTLYDLGYASLEEIEKAAILWRSGTIHPINPLKERMRNRAEASKKQHATLRPQVDPDGLLIDSGVYDALQARQPVKALRRLNSVLRSSIPRESYQTILIVKAQIQRRRAARGTLDAACRLLEEIEPDCLPAERAPLYYYELGYVQQLMGMPEEAGECFRLSWQHASALGDRYAPLEALIAEVQKLATEVIAMAVVGPVPSDTVASMVTRLNAATARAEEMDGVFGGRWALNCRIWKVKLFLKLGDYERASEAFSETKEFRDRQDVTTGWTLLARPYITVLEGLLLLGSRPSKEQTEKGLRLLARALVPLLGARRQRPEEIRDMLLGFEVGLRQHRDRRDEALAEGIAKVRTRIRDGSSVLDPCRSLRGA